MLDALYLFMKKYSSDKDINKLVTRMCKIGWRFINRKKHGALITPNGKKITVPSSPSDRRAVVVKSFWPRVYKIASALFPIYLGSNHRYMNAV